MLCYKNSASLTFLLSSALSFQLTDDDDASSDDVAICRKLKGTRRGRAPKEVSSRRLGLAQNRRLQRVLQDSHNLKSGAWPRPPVNYCILIAMALSSSRSGSLNVQQIYNFTRWTKAYWEIALDLKLCFCSSLIDTFMQLSHGIFISL